MQNNSTLNTISLLAFAFVAVVVIINLFTTNNYGRSNKEVTEMLASQPMLNFHELHHVLAQNPDEILLIDLREEADFIAGHLPGAINIPLATLLTSSHLRQLRRAKNSLIVLYGTTEAQAQGARLLLLAKGLQPNLRVLGGNYEMAVRYATENFNPAFASYKDEKARFDYRRFMGTARPAQSSRPQPAGIIPTLQTAAAPAGGGC
ncbi:MAG: rhodanese-like domain-containing protein [Bacteroidales bacterium]